ncbi:MAG: THUMP domain-containing protein [archaeon]
MILVKYGEIALKGGNRHLFEKKLQNNIKSCLKKNNVEYEKVQRVRGRILIITEQECPKLKDVFGIHSFSYIKPITLDLEIMKKEALKLYEKGTFRVSCKRSDKIFLKSPEIEREVGAYIVEKTNAKVKLKNPETEIFIEVFNNQAHIYNKKHMGLGGLPVGIQGTVGLLLQDESSIEAGIKLMKRGCDLILIKEKDINIEKLKQYEYGFRLDYGTKEDVFALVVNDTIKNIKEYDEDKLILRPLI